jgi:methyl-accepting chemotaxis protein
MKYFESLRFRFLAAFGALLLVVCCVMAIFGVRQMRALAVDAFAEDGEHLAEEAAKLVDVNAFVDITESLDSADPRYVRMQKALLALKETSSAAYLFTAIPSGDDEITYIIDGSASPDDKDNFSPPGATDSASHDPAYRKCLDSLKVTHTTLVDRGDWGWVITSFAPLVQNGRSVGYVGVDYQGDDLRKNIQASALEYAALGAIFFLGGMALLIVFLRMIFGPIGLLVTSLNSLGEGDFTGSLPARTKDEMGQMAAAFNKTVRNISALVAGIKQRASALSEVGAKLASNMTDTASAVNEITSSIDSIKGRIVNQSASVTETGATMEQITGNIEKLSEVIQTQSASVSQASSAIEEMMANIQSVTQTLVKNGDNVKSLSDASTIGHQGLQEVAADIQEIARQSEGLMEINAVIENIASQTNLLSMNAAIEAAHAGEAGKGFAVVADEIRKLAESSSAQSRTISEVLKNITASIDKISGSTNSVLTKFEAITNGIKTVDEQEQTIRSAMEEQTEGSKQILEGVAKVNDITTTVKNSAAQMLEGSRQVVAESRNLEAATGEISSGINEMASGAEQINNSITSVNELSGTNEAEIAALSEDVAKFRVGN